jgi:cytochrome o ubiquinol oxidase subunit 2
MSSFRVLPPFARRFSRLAGLGLLLSLAGCNTIVMKPHGDIAVQQAHLITIATWLMLLIIVPVILLTLLFAWRYRQSNTEATYLPDWDHSTRLELVIWGAPLLIIIALGAVTWISTHKLDPFRPLDRIDAQHALAPDVKPLVVDVVSLDWKWLFIYPEQGVATVNELAAPVNRPIEFRMTSSTVMNAFYIPALAGMIYTMPSMTTELHAVINQPGTYDGFSANYSGAGFSDMRFKFLGLSDADFERWIAGNKASGAALTRADYAKLEQPSIAVPVMRFASVEKGLFDAIVDRCSDGGTMCNSQMMAIDAAGGLGKGGIGNVAEQAFRGQQRPVVAPLCTPQAAAEAKAGDKPKAPPAVIAAAAPQGALLAAADASRAPTARAAQP